MFLCLCFLFRIVSSYFFVAAATHAARFAVTSVPFVLAFPKPWRRWHFCTCPPIVLERLFLFLYVSGVWKQVTVTSQRGNYLIFNPVTGAGDVVSVSATENVII